MQKNIDNSKIALYLIFKIPFGTRRMYLNAVQSLLWNKSVSKRLIAHGTKILDGDLIEIGTTKQIYSSAKQYDQPPTLKNLTMPLFGSDTQIECSEVKNIVTECIEDFGMSYEEFKSTLALNKMLSNDRKIIQCPADFEYQINHDSIQLDFSLNSSCYATELLREVTNSKYYYN